MALSAGAGPEAPALRPWTRGDTPALAGTTLSGQPFDLAMLRGRAVLVSFWASWCEPCREELPALVALASRLRGRPFALVTVNLGEGRGRAARFLAEIGTDLPTLLDPDRVAGEAWGVRGLPMAFLVDAAGKVRWWVFGACDWSEGETAAALEELVKAP